MLCLMLLTISALNFLDELFLLRIWSESMFQIGVSVKNQNTLDPNAMAR